jgi:hypothetical protein
MKNIAKSIGLYIIASAIIWGVVIIGCASKLKGTDCFQEIIYILSAGAGIHLILIWGPLANQFKKLTKEE